MGNKLKDLEKCKHPNSRKTIAMVKQVKRASNKEKARTGQAIKQNIIGEKFLWFKERLDENCNCFNAQQTENLINSYLNRFNDELEQIKLKHSIGQRKNRQHASREDIINLTVKREREEFQTCGLEIPDIMNSKNVEAIRKWKGELRYLQNLKSKRISEKFLQNAKMKTKQNTTELKKENDDTIECIANIVEKSGEMEID